jgi:D-alanine-D-alanine ligase
MIKKKIAIFCGGPSSEHEVSINSARTIYQKIDKEKYELYFFYISKKGACKLLLAEDKIQFDKVATSTPLMRGLADLKRKKIFALLAGIHGEFVEDGKLQTILEVLQIPFSGSDSKGSAIAMDKYISCQLAKNIKGIAIPKTHLITKAQNINDYSYPLFVKPNELGSSVGVFIVNNRKELKEAIDHLRNDLQINKILVQEYLKNAIEIQCGCLQKRDGGFITLPPIEIRPKKAKFFDYASKYEVGGSEEITPPVSISKKISDEISKLAITLHKELGLRTYSRSDFLLRDGKIYYLETNTLPGMTSTSLLPQEANCIGISFPQLLDFIISNS